MAQPWAGPERQVSPGGIQPAVAVDGKGNFIVAWLENQTADIFVQRFSAAGPKLGELVRVNTTTDGTQIYPVVAADRAGNFVVVWQGGYYAGLNERGGDGDGPGIFGQLFDATGAKRGGQFLVNLVTSGQQTRPQVAMAPDGRFAVSWDDDRRPASTYVTVAMRAFAADGKPYRYQVQPASRRDARGSIIAMSTEGIALGWAESYEYHCPSYQCVDFFPYVQVFKADGLPRDRRRLLAESGIVSQILTAQGKGDFLVLMEAGNGGLRGQRLTASGQRTGKVLRIAAPESAEPVRFESAAMDSSGRLAVLWELGEPINNRDGSLVGRLFDAKGTAQGDFFPVTLRPSTEPQDSAVALADDGAFAVVWVRENLVDRPAGLVRRWFRRQ